MSFDKDKAALWTSLAALLVSIASPIISYRWLNQSERDDKDKKQLLVYFTTSEDTEPSMNAKTGEVTNDYTFVLSKGGVLPVANVEIVMQFPEKLQDHIRVSVNSNLDTEPVKVNNGRARIALKRQLAPTSQDIEIIVRATFPRPSKSVKDEQALKAAWLFTDAISYAPITSAGGSSSY